jgi:hypothetical protein
MPKYLKICRIKFNYSSVNAAVHGDYYVLSMYIVCNKICIYIKILAVVITRVEQTKKCEAARI